MKVRVYHYANGEVAVIRPNPKLRRAHETDDEFLDRICAKDAPLSGLDHIPFVDIDQSELPPRNQRKQWQMQQGRVGIKQMGSR